MSELKATIVDDENAILSVDDLIMQIGILNVKILEKDRAFQRVLQRLQELEKQNSELRNTINQLSGIKNDYNVLARRFNDLQEELKRREIELAQCKNIITQKDNEISSLKAKLEILESKKKK